MAISSLINTLIRNSEDFSMFVPCYFLLLFWPARQELVRAPSKGGPTKKSLHEVGKTDFQLSCRTDKGYCWDLQPTFLVLLSIKQRWFFENQSFHVTVSYGKVYLVKSHEGICKREGRAPCILDLSTRRRRVIGYMPCAFSLSRRALDTYSVGGWEDNTAGVDTVNKGKAFYPYQETRISQSASLWPSHYVDWTIIHSREFPL